VSRLTTLFTVALVLFAQAALFAQKKSKIVWQPVTTTPVECYDFWEMTLSNPKPVAANPFKDVALEGEVKTPDGKTVKIEGFCDAQDGSVYKIRFMPSVLGRHTYQLKFRQNGVEVPTEGSFEAVASKRKGPLRLDVANPEHFIYENGDHFFWNSTTCYWMLGWKDEAVIQKSLDRLASYGINRIRVAINGRAHGGDRWNEKTVVECDEFTFKLNPWVAAKPSDLDDPQFDVSRPNVAHWQKMDRLLLHARARGIIVSFIFYVDGLDHGCDPFKKANMGNADEQLYYAYAAARYSAFENIMWDIANEYHLFRTPEWANQIAPFLKSKDPYKHLMSVHGSADFPFRKAPWVDVIMYQSWDECGGYDFIQQARTAQAATGRILPTINEEYGYEGHYSVWGCGATAGKDRPDGRFGLNRSQLAWEMCMAGAYQTTGETAEYGTGAGENTGGGWINGRGNDKMTMLRYYKIMKDIFEQTQYWKLKPRPDLVNVGNFCLADEGREYLLYSRVQHCRVRLPAGQKYSVTMINPQTGESKQLADADSSIDNNAWQYRRHLEGFWVFILKRK
jgi:Protein of unknown function (DUF4038)/Domain of unknown function (DUF5060)